MSSRPRPRTPEGPRTERVDVRLAPVERARLAEAAERHGLTESELVRRRSGLTVVTIDEEGER